MRVRELGEADLPAALHLSESAGWNQNLEDWKRLLSLAKCFGVEADDRVVASISVMSYGTDLAWIGMVLTLPEFRGRGYASNLMTTAMDHLTGMNVRCIKLDATEAGAPVYRKFGFEDECAVERWRRASVHSLGSEVQKDAGDLDHVDWQLDASAFGADRRVLLSTFPAVRVEFDGHAMVRPGRTHAQFGPCVARSQGTAEGLATWAIQGHGELFWDLFEQQHAAKDVAHRCGFTPARKLLRMSYRGIEIEEEPANVYGLAGFEWG